MFLEEFSRGLDELEGDKLVASLFESLDDLTDEVSLDAVWLDHDEGLFVGHFFWKICFCFLAY